MLTRPPLQLGAAGEPIITLSSFSSSLAINVVEGILQSRGSTTVTTATMMAQVGDTVNAKMFTVELETFTNIHSLSPTRHAATARGVKTEASVSPFLKPNSVPVAGVPQISTAPSSALFSTIWGSYPAASEVGIVQRRHTLWFAKTYCSFSIVNSILYEFIG